MVKKLFPIVLFSLPALAQQKLQKMPFPPLNHLRFLVQFMHTLYGTAMMRSGINSLNTGVRQVLLSGLFV